MAEFLVTIEAEVVDPDDGVPSLREAVQAANASTAEAPCSSTTRSASRRMSGT